MYPFGNHYTNGKKNPYSRQNINDVGPLKMTLLKNYESTARIPFLRLKRFEFLSCSGKQNSC